MEASLWTPLVQVGGIGIVLLWFMFKSEPRLRSMEASIDRMSRSILLLIISIPQATEVIKQQAHGLLQEIDEAQRQKDKP